MINRMINFNNVVADRKHLTEKIDKKDRKKALYLIEKEDKDKNKSVKNDE